MSSRDARSAAAMSEISEDVDHRKHVADPFKQRYIAFAAVRAPPPPPHTLRFCVFLAR
jgi:hypothetical protein